jgi:hypothetical protein
MTIAELAPSQRSEYPVAESTHSLAMQTLCLNRPFHSKWLDTGK